MDKYNPQNIEKKWQEKWESSELFQASESSKKPKFYSLGMFPYPSGSGLHVGHPEGYTATDIHAKFQMMHGYNVLHPMGFDAFGLPAENYAIKTGRKPQETTAENMDTFRRQLKSIGLGYDWTREVNTSSPEYYKWTQWFFLLLYKNNLAYKKNAPVNWCEKDQTVLANEQVVNGKCDRCGTPVIQKNLSQWFFKITEFADDLLSGLDKLDWPESLKSIQKNWIGRSTGAEVKFHLKDTDQTVEVYTTRPDTLFGATYLVLAPEHEILNKLKDKIENWEDVLDYQATTKGKSELERTELNKTKSGVNLKGISAINPVTREEIPVFISDYVLVTYGTGAIMAVPAHDQRDFEFAQKFNLPIKQVIAGGDISKAAHEGSGEMINSGFLDGLNVEQSKVEIVSYIEKHNLGVAKTNFRLRDWLVSRQRYWGTPIPIIYCETCGEVPVPEDQLPVILPTDVDFMPTGESPLVNSKSFHQVNCPKCHEPARRESDTMDTFVCSSWYYFRYADPKNDQAFADKKLLKKWLPVDLYVGGVEHAVLHLLYARFFTKVLQRFKYIDFDEPFLSLRNQGMILGEDGEKMSKSVGNVINPDDVINEYGADTLRVYLMFMGPFEDMKPWSTKSITGSRRFLDRVWNTMDKISDVPLDRDLETLLHQTIKKVTEDIIAFRFNTAISSLMILNNKMLEVGCTKESYAIMLQLLSPIAPHITEEAWSLLGNKDSIFTSTWPTFDPNKIVASVFEVPIQINSKIRSKIFITLDDDEAAVKEKALADEKIAPLVAGKDVKKIIYVERKIINIIVE